MKRAFLTLAAISAAATLNQTATADHKATLRLLDDTAPVRLRGTGFQAGERVRIIAVTNARIVRKTTANSRGTFVVRLPGLDPNACQGLSITATGSRGTRATLKRTPGQCPSLQPRPADRTTQP